MAKNKATWKKAIASSDLSDMTGDVHGNLVRYTKSRYAEFWQNTVLMDWFKLYVYQSSDTENVRDLDIVADAPAFAAHIAKATGGKFEPQDVLVGIGYAMMTKSGISDPDLWAAIDVGQVVCRHHYGNFAGFPTWECRISILAGAALAAFATNPTMKGAVSMHHQDGSAVQVPKIYRLVDYLVWIAAQERYLDLSAVGKTDNVSRFRKEEELFLSLLTRAADAALEHRAEWTPGPASTSTIAERGYHLMMEVLQDILPVELPIPVELAPQAVPAPRPVRI
ncbi:hypothetical protein ACVIGB_000433 [Bradyrhizobium sp. USDA 4341]